MAKINARGRVEIVRIVRRIETAEEVGTNTSALMSDGRVLTKTRRVHKVDSWKSDDGHWTVTNRGEPLFNLVTDDVALSWAMTRQLKAEAHMSATCEEKGNSWSVTTKWQDCQLGMKHERLMAGERELAALRQQVAELKLRVLCQQAGKLTEVAS